MKAYERGNNQPARVSLPDPDPVPALAPAGFGYKRNDGHGTGQTQTFPINTISSQFLLHQATTALAHRISSISDLSVIFSQQWCYLRQHLKVMSRFTPLLPRVMSESPRLTSQVQDARKLYTKGSCVSDHQR
ncbi:hypothetical protein V6N13_035680 [Hibiscus sabdariffa]